MSRPPRVPLEKMPFPRRLASSEIKRFWNVFNRRMLELGINPEDDEVMEHFIAFRDAYHQNWYVVLENFEAMIRDIIEGKPPARYPPPPMPWKELPKDAILHLLATKEYKSMDELIKGLECYGIYVTSEEVREVVKKEWMKKPKDSWLLVTPKDYLCQVLGLKPEDLPE